MNSLNPAAAVAESPREIGPGDLVRLKSGGPIMTGHGVNVMGVCGHLVECSWFMPVNENGCMSYSLGHHAFSPACLEVFRRA